MSLWILTVVLGACLTEVTSGQSCSRSSDCAASHCCRDSITNNILVDDPQGPFEQILVEGQGHCVAGGSAPGDMCDSRCQCPVGYECYRRVTGVCCAPRTCITIAEANADREFWLCHPPPPAAPGGKKRHSENRRNVFLSVLCPQLPAVPGQVEP